MFKTVDRIIINIAVWLILLALSIYVSNYIVLSVVISTIVFILGKSLINLIPKRDKTLITRADKQKAYYAVNKCLDKFANVFKTELNPRIENDFVALDIDGKNCAVYPMISLTPINYKDVLPVAEKAKEKYDKLFLICADVDNTVNAVKPYLPITTDEISYYSLFPTLEKTYPQNAVKIKRKFNFKIAHNRSLLFGGLSLILLSFIVPMRLYYIITGTLSIMLYALGSINYNKKSPLV